jgi:hypothetical protein
MPREPLRVPLVDKLPAHRAPIPIAARGALGIALGAFELAYPSVIAQIDRLDARAEGLVRVAGAHKLVAGAGLLTARDARPWLMLALAGAAFDAVSLASKRAKPSALMTVAAMALVDAALLWNASKQ